MKRTELQRRTPLLARTPMRRTRMRQGRTERLRASGEVLQAVKAAVWTRDRGLCWVCGGRGFDFHHRMPRGMGGASRRPEVHSPANLVVLCREHHDHYERLARAEATDDLGLIIRHGQRKPQEVPIRQGDRLWLLDDAGGRTEVAG